MNRFKTILSKAQLALALIQLERETRQMARQCGVTDNFHAQFTARSNEVMQVVSPMDCELASAMIEHILLDLGIDPAGNLGFRTEMPHSIKGTPFDEWDTRMDVETTSR